MLCRCQRLRRRYLLAAFQTEAISSASIQHASAAQRRRNFAAKAASCRLRSVTCLPAGKHAYTLIFFKMIFHFRIKETGIYFVCSKSEDEVPHHPSVFIVTYRQSAFSDCREMMTHASFANAFSRITYS